MPAVYNELVKSLATCNEGTIVKKLHDIPQLKKASHDYIFSTVNSEIEVYCKNETGAILKSKGNAENDLKVFSYEQLEDELEVKTPLFLRLIKAATFNPSHIHNKRKTNEYMKPAMLSAAAKLINIHTDDMNIHKQLVSIIAKKGGLKKMGFVRLGKTYDVMSYEHVTGMLDSYAAKFDDTIKVWKSEVEMDVGHPGYTLANDNVDWEVGHWQMTAMNQRKSVHKINMVAYENRVNSTLLPDDGPQVDIRSVPLQDILPSAADNVLLMDNLVILLGNLWADSIPALSWWKDHLPPNIVHQCQKEMKKKTAKTPIRLYNYDQKNVDDVEQFLIEVHSKFVPNHDEENREKKPSRTILRADYLGFERQKNAQSQVHDARTPSQRLEGFVSALSDFHAQAAWHKVAWHCLYDTQTGRDVGTLYHAREVTESRNVTKDPHDDFYAAEDLLDKFTHAYLIAGALHHFGMEAIESDITQNIVSKETKSPKEEIVRVVNAFLTDHVLNPPPSLPEDDILKCRFCSKVYKNHKSMDTHEKKQRFACKSYTT